MSTPESKIRAGIASGRGFTPKKSTKAAPPALAHLAGLRGDLQAIKTARAAVVSAHAQIESIRAGVSKHIESETAKIRDHYAREGIVREENGDGTAHVTDLIGPDRRKALVTLKVSQMENAARKVYTDTLAANLDKIREARARLDAMAALWSDPIDVLMRSTVADKNRATYTANLAAIGPEGVSNAARQAVMTGDLALAASCIARIESMNKDSRKSLTVSAEQLADAIMRERIVEARREIGLAGIQADRAEFSYREAQGREITTGERMALEAKTRDLANELGLDVADLEAKAAEPVKVSSPADPGDLAAGGTINSLDEYEKARAETAAWFENHEAENAARSEFYDHLLAGRRTEARALADKWDFYMEPEDSAGA